MGKYRTIVADPPWDHGDGYATLPGGVMKTYSGGSVPKKPLPYQHMSLQEICALPVGALSDTDARLFLWTTNRYLPAAFDVLRHWGFVYKQTVIWHKKGNPSPFGGSVAPNHAEFLLVAVKGGPPILSRWKSNVIEVNVGAHSVKPELFLDLIEQASDAPRLELFARTQRLGWDTWGNEALCHVALDTSPAGSTPEGRG